MREFVVTLRNGARYTVKADRAVIDRPYLALEASRAPSVGDPHPPADVVALFDERLVSHVVAREHLVSEEKGEPVGPAFVARDPDADIPF